MQRKRNQTKESRLIKYFNRAALAAVAVVALGLWTPRMAKASLWDEIVNGGGDAGDLLATAQETVSSNPLTAITGTIGSSSDVDMYKIYISTPAAFSATTVGPTGTLVDTQLFLFDSAGMGVYANDDQSGGGTRSTLPAVHAFSPTLAGDYFIVITGFNRDPLSGGGAIFPNAPFTGVFGPTGAGGGSPITGYGGNNPQNTGSYTIILTDPEFALTGSESIPGVPEPASLLLLGFGIAGVATRRFKKRG